MANIFSNDTKSIDLMKTDANIVRVNMVEQEIGGRKSLVNSIKRQDDGTMSVDHVPNRGTAP